MHHPDNPFRPSPGRRPPLIAGRASEALRLSNAIDELVPGAEAGPTEVVMYGPRGVGKTTLVEEMAARCRKLDESGEKPINVIHSTPTLGMDDPANVVKSLIDPSLFEKTIKLIGFRWRHPDKIGVPGAMKWMAPEKPFYQPLVDTIIEECHEKPKALFIDEAHALPPESKRIIAAVSNAVSLRAPFFLVLAGTPELNSKLIDTGETYLERAWEMPLGNLDPESAAAAISEPCKEGRMPIAPDALEIAVEDAHCYPYFLQMWGAYLWDHAKQRGDDKITMKDVAGAAPDVERHRASFYNKRYRKFVADDEFLSAARAVASAWKSGEEINIDGLIQIAEDSLPETTDDKREKARSLAEEIEKSDLVWCRSDVFEPGIPSFLTFINDLDRNRDGPGDGLGR